MVLWRCLPKVCWKAGQEQGYFSMSSMSQAPLSAQRANPTQPPRSLRKRELVLGTSQNGQRSERTNQWPQGQNHTWCESCPLSTVKSGQQRKELQKVGRCQMAVHACHFFGAYEHSQRCLNIRGSGCPCRVASQIWLRKRPENMRNGLSTQTPGEEGNAYPDGMSCFPEGTFPCFLSRREVLRLTVHTASTSPNIW